MLRTAVAYCIHDDVDYLQLSLLSLTQNFEAGRAEAPAGNVFAFISRAPWHGKPGDWEAAAASAEALGATVVLGDWPTEQIQRQALIDHLLALDYIHALIPDGDEIIEPAHLRTLLVLAENEMADRVYVHWDTYWKTPEYVIRPRERFTPCYLIDLRVAKPTGGRNFEGGRPLLLGPEYGLVHHLSWVGPERRIRRKRETWGHAKEVLPGWEQRVWRGWDGDKLMRGLHPTHPEAYGFAERIAPPEILLPALARYRKLAGTGSEAPVLTPGAKWPDISVVIPVHGGHEDLAACLGALAPLHGEGLIRSVVVVDNASPDCAAGKEAEAHPFVKLIENETNTGFAHACNQGAEAAGEDDHLLFLNSDAILTRAGLIRLGESLQRSGSIGGVGPLTNNAGHGQKITPTYTSLDNLPLFADDFAQRDNEDEDRDMLVGFCLLVRRSVWDEVTDSMTGQGFDERFGLGTWEDNDLCYRIRRAGYRLALSARAFVHHGGSKTLVRIYSEQTDGVAPNVSALLERNRRKFLAKWRDDLDSGFASSLSGLTAERITFDPSRHPDIRLRKTRERAKLADISLVMIVRNEERVLGDCLASAAPFFRETIVVDTGSTDRTVRIARAHGARVFSFPWTDSFSEARNESLRHASGKWVFWLDADDSLPFAAGEAILEAALKAPDSVCGFVVPVQFVEPEPGEDGTVAPSAAGTRVDHVKLFRKLPGLAFEGRIHEQILPSLREVTAQAGAIARCSGAAVVLHTGYDTSPAGQAKKRERDAKLLKLDLEERPDHPFVLFNLGMTDHYAAEHASAVDWLRKSIDAASRGESHIRKAYALMAVSLRELGRAGEALAAIEEGLAAIGDADPELHFHAGFILTQMGRYAEARAHYEKAANADASGFFSSFDIGILGYKTYHNLGQVCSLMGDYDEAKRWWLAAVDAAPQFLPSAFDLFHAALEHGDTTTAQSMLDVVARQQGQGETWSAMKSMLNGGRNSHGGHSKDPGRTHEAGCEADVDPRLDLARRLLQSGDETAALPHLTALASDGVAEAAFYLGVCAIRRGDHTEALGHMEHAHRLNPAHQATTDQVARLRAAVTTASVG